ncbi:MAG: phosphohydrolase [Planctomycetes bacterium RBG_13_63_9]|nr:MAG: phosphohydrolase [Planctomycetes bacterium RBG_13_63_9]
MANPTTPRVDLRRVLAGAQLPALPQSAIRLLELSQDPDNGPVEFATPIEADPGLTGQVLRFVNSSYFGFSREIATVKLAITLVGIRTIKNFALWSAVFSLMPNPKCGRFDLKCLWQDSLHRAVFARAVAKVLAVKDAEEPFAAALLQDMAVPLLAKELPSVYAQLLETRNGGRIRLSSVENHVFGWNHGEAAGIMARQWNLPEESALLIEGHQTIERWASHTDAEPGRLAVALSALLPSAADTVWHERELLDDYYQKLAPGGAAPLPELLAQTDREFAEFAPVFKVSASNKSLVDSYNEPVATPS